MNRLAEEEWVKRAAELLRCPADRWLSFRVAPGEGISVITPEGRKVFFSAAELQDSPKPGKAAPTERKPPSGRKVPGDAGPAKR